MRTKTNVIASALAAFGLAATLAGCGKDAENRRFGVGKRGNASDLRSEDVNMGDNGAGKTEDGDKPLYALVASVGVRNFDQINLTFAKLTGISPTTPAVATMYKTVKNDLPNSNDIKAMTPAKVSAITKLAAQYCDSLVADAAKRAVIFGSFNFAALPAAAFAAPEPLAQSIIDAFWGKDLESLAKKEDDVKEMAALIRAMAQGKANTAAVTSAVVMGACTAALTAAPAILM